MIAPNNRGAYSGVLKEMFTAARAQGWFQIVPIKKGVGREKQSEGLRTAHQLGAQFSQRISFVNIYIYTLATLCVTAAVYRIVIMRARPACIYKKGVLQK